jgi:hypothetical protein
VVIIAVVLQRGITAITAGCAWENNVVDAVDYSSALLLDLSDIF